MSNKLYKYVGHTYLDKVFGLSDKVTLKCSYPKDFNDAYELFLTIDYTENPGALAFYDDLIGDLPQRPTTCFSRSPIVAPMWAHYAQNLEGFVIEFDEDALKRCFPESNFDNIDYRDEPNGDINDSLYRAYEIGKPRYLYLLRGHVFRAAYFTKTICWSYEQERRMLIHESEIRQTEGLMLADVPMDCVSAFICGPRASAETQTYLQEKAAQLDCRYYQLKIGRSSCVPFLVDLKGEVSVFNGETIDSCSSCCDKCKEPISSESKLCSWCQIDEGHKVDAAQRNTYRMLDNYGLLGEYINGMNSITRGETL